MEDDQSFVAALSEAVEQRRRHIEQTELPELKERFRVYHASLQSLVAVMVRKGLIQEDPYKHEQKISDIVMDEDTEFSESERVVVTGIRLSKLDNVLEYANNYVDFSLRELGFTQIKRLIDLAKFVAWDELKLNSPRPTTRAITAMLDKLRAGADSFASGILTSALNQLRDGCREIVNRLKEIRVYQRERYKLDLRTMVLPKVPPDSPLKPNDPESLKRVRTVFARSGMDEPFIPELVSEIIAEEFGPNAVARRQEALKRLQTPADPRKTRKGAPAPLRQVLVDSVRSLAAASRSLDSALERLRDNAAVINARKRSFSERLREWMDRLMNRKPEQQLYELEFMDDTTGTRHRESVDLDAFLELLHKKSQVFAGILSRTGSLWSKIEKANEDQLYQFVNKELGDMHLIHRRATAFDSYFKAQATRDEKRRLRGIKIELTTMRNAIAKANQLKHEYISRKEEQEQLKKLGIKAN